MSQAILPSMDPSQPGSANVNVSQTTEPPPPFDEDGAVGAVQHLKYDSMSRTIFLWGDIDHESALQFISTLMAVDTGEPIRVVMFSDGGCWQSGLAIYDAIRMARSEVIIDVYGTCCSTAAAILQAGDLRRMAPNADFMIHEGSISTGESSKNYADLKAMTKHSGASNDIFYRIMAERSGMSAAKVKRLCKSDFYLQAAEAVEMGFADCLIEPEEE